MGDVKTEWVGWETPAEWELEQRAFNWNAAWAETDTRELVQDLWRQYCFAATPTPNGVVIKPLEWTDVGSGFVREEAKCILGLYRIAQSASTSVSTWHWSHNALDGLWSLPFPTQDEARAAVHADYERGIRSTFAEPEATSK